MYVIGCSHSRYVWPTYANILGQEYDNFYNWAGSGFGNYAIMHRAIEVSKLMKPEDDLIIQWTYPSRFDFHIFGQGWYRGGNLINNHDSVQQAILTYAYDPDSYQFQTDNHIELTTTYLKSKNINFRMLASDYDVGDLPAISISNNFDIPFRKFLNVRPDIKMVKKETDHHFTPTHHLEYLRQTDFTITQKMLQYVEQSEKLIDTIHDWKWLQFKFEKAELIDRETYGK